jgi:peptidoglycan/xylan/chitin deacetylase (PgdA/CDA1 family)
LAAQSLGGYMEESGKFIISLDFELMWGVRDIVNTNTYSNNIKGVHQALPKLLQYFTKYQVKGTFAAVGFLFFENKSELLAHLPVSKPQYTDNNLSPYGEYIDKCVGENLADDPCHFGSHLIEAIKKTPGQEIGTHTFSHFYCLEPGQTIENFKQDLQAAISIAKKKQVSISSIVFPRNQVNENYLTVCADMGITSYRSNEKSWIYEARSGQHESLWRRSLRLVDAYINLSGYHCYDDSHMKDSVIINIPSSRFLRPYSERLKLLEKLRLKRIKKSMDFAAKNNLLYHIWWHPHNFGTDQDQNFWFLEEILKHYEYLNKKYGFTSYTMSGYAEKLGVKKAGLSLANQ